jgi:hypothetical protein
MAVPEVILSFSSGTTNLYGLVDAFSAQPSSISQAQNLNYGASLRTLFPNNEDTNNEDNNNEETRITSNDYQYHMKKCNGEQPNSDFKLDSRSVSIIIFKQFFDKKIRAQPANSPTTMLESLNRMHAMLGSELDKRGERIYGRIKKEDNYINELELYEKIRPDFDGPTADKDAKEFYKKLYFETQSEYADYITTCLPIYINEYVKALFYDNNNAKKRKTSDVLTSLEPNYQWVNNESVPPPYAFKAASDAFKSALSSAQIPPSQPLLVGEDVLPNRNYVPIYSGLSEYRTKIIDTLWGNLVHHHVNGTVIELPSLFSTSFDMNTALKFIAPPQVVKTSDDVPMITHIPVLIVFYMPLGKANLKLAPFIKFPAGPNTYTINLTKKIKTCPDLEYENEMLLLHSIKFKIIKKVEMVSLPFMAKRYAEHLKPYIYCDLYQNITVYHLLYMDDADQGEKNHADQVKKGAKRGGKKKRKTTTKNRKHKKKHKYTKYRTSKNKKKMSRRKRSDRKSKRKIFNV